MKRLGAFLHKHIFWLYRLVMMILDCACLVAAGMLALLTRFEFVYDAIDPRFLSAFFKILPVSIAAMLVIFLMLRLYHSVWRYAGLTEMLSVCLAAFLVTVFEYASTLVLDSYLPLSFYPINFLYLTVLTGSLRLLSRVLHISRAKSQKNADSQNIMIIGGGSAGTAIIKEIQSSRHLGGKVRCIIDDDVSKHGRYICGVRIVGGRDLIPKYAKKYNISQIIIAMPSQSNKTVKEILDICKETDCELKRLPGLYQLVSGEVGVSSVRDVEINDLLGREPVETDPGSIGGYVTGKTILVTGGGGSIGSELCRQICAHEPKKLIILDIYENNAYEIQQELQKSYPELDLTVLIGSVRNTNRMFDIFRTYRPHIVYHAAAHKHVPLMEQSPDEAIKNNVFGTLKTVRAADEYGAEKFILISTDKAVNPTNIMGASKRICEMIIQAYNRRSKTEFTAVRFGNVLGSNGSVIPLFKKQIEQGGPVTVTHPDIIRYFMTIKEAVSLVLQAGAYGSGGEIFVLDMGEPVKIIDLARNMIRLSGLKPDEDIEIKITGLRPGEKLYEELLMDEEGLKQTDNDMIYIGKPIEFKEEEFFASLEKLRKAAESETKDIREMIRNIVPTYRPGEAK